MPGLQQLQAQVEQCSHAGIARQVLLLRAHRLHRAPVRSHYLRLAEAALVPLLQLPRAELFHLPGPNLAVLWRGEAEDALLDVVESLEHMLAGADGPPMPDLLALYDLPDAGDLLLGECAAAASDQPDDAPLAASLDPASLALLETCLAQADIARFARRQTVWQIGAGVPAPVWEDRSLSLAELTEAVAHGHDLQAEPWLFRRLTRTLDRRTLALLASPGELANARPFSVTLNVASLLAPEFLRFDAALPPGLRGRVVLALTPADVVAEAARTSFACGFARARGYRMLLRVGPPEALPLMRPSALDFEYVAVDWSDAMGSAAQDAVARHAPGRLVLSGCGTDQAVAWGRAAGVGLFAGLAADRVGAAG